MRRFSTVGRRHGGALGLYLLVSLLLSWPLVAHFTTHVTGDGIDDPALAWNLWWIKFQWVDQLQPDIFHVGWMFHPIQVNLAFYTLTPLNGLLSIPLQGAFGLVPANNLLLLSSFVLSGFGTYLLVQTVWPHRFVQTPPRRAWWIAWLAGAFYAFASAKFFYASLGQFNIASSGWLPFACLYFWRALQPAPLRQSVRAGLLAGLFLTLQAWAELTYASFLLVFVALLYLWFLVRWARQTPRTWRRVWRVTAAYLSAGALFLVGIAPFLAAMLPDLRREGDFFASGGGFAETFSADLLGFLLPTRLHPWFGGFVTALPFPNDKGQQIYLGYALMSLLIVAAIYTVTGTSRDQGRDRPSLRFWLGALLFFGWLTLGPVVHWAGEASGIPGPFALISRLPFFSGNRYPSRYSVLLLLSAAVLAAYALLRLTEARPRRTAAGILAATALIFGLEQLSAPLPLNDFRIPPIYAQLAAQPGDFAVLELPTGWRNGARVLGRADVLIMMQQWYQSAHTKRRLGGNTSRNPAQKFQYFSEIPVVAQWIALMNADRSHIAPVVAQEFDDWVAQAQTDAPDLLDLWGVRYLLLYEAQATPALIAYVEQALPLTWVDTWQGEDWRGDPSTIRLYRVDSPPPAPQTVDMATPQANRLLAEGWSPLGDPGQGRLALRRQVDLILPALRDGGQVTLEFTQPATVTYRLAGRPLAEITGRTHRLTIPADPHRAPSPRLTLDFGDAPTPAPQLASMPSPIGTTGATLAPGVTLLVRSAGEEVGNLAEIWLNGRNVAPGSRGYNIAALSPTGDLWEVARFDTFIAGESLRMAAWLDAQPPGTILAGAVADEASLALDQAGVDALGRVGVAGDLRGRFRASHAWIGLVGAAPAAAVEDLTTIAPASVWLGAPAAAPLIYGALQSVTLTPQAPPLPTP
jgi:hypothetical protein